MNVIIVDDDSVSRELLKICVERTENLHLVATCTSIPEVMNVLKEEKNVDLILLDIEMPGISGMDFLNTFKDIPEVVIISSKKDYAAEAFENNVTDYIVKPVTYERFLKAINKVNNSENSLKVDSENADFIFVRHKNRLQRVAINEIDYTEANADYVNLVAGEMKYVIHSSMKNIEAKLPSRQFVRVHRSFIVNLSKVKTVEENTLYMSTKGLTIPIGRLYKEQLMNRLNLV
jgi:DNA-binding LytR/AlgR family response regulator